jgi:hypothetical protein
VKPWRLRSPWTRWGASFALILALGIAPWPGWGESWADFYCEVASAIADVAPTAGLRVLFRPGDDASKGEERRPWQVYVYVQRPDDGAIDRFVQNGRMEYVSLVAFFALAGASALQGWKTRALWTIGLPLLLAIMVVNEVVEVVLAIDRWHWSSLGPAIEVALSAIHTLFHGLPVTPFALPGLIWWSLLRHANVAALWRLRREESV